MKKLLVLLLLVAGNVFAAPYDLYMNQMNQFGSGTLNRQLTVPNMGIGVDGVLYYNSVTTLPAIATLGYGCSISSGVLGCLGSSQVNADWNSVGGVSQILNKPAFATVATTGSYADLLNKPSIPSVLPASQSASTRTLNSIFQISATRAALAIYSVQCTVTASIAGGQNCDVILEIASDSGFTTNVQTLSINGVGQTYTLAVALQGVQPQTSVVTGFVPAGFYVRLRTVNNTGTPSFLYRAGQEVLM